MSSARITYDGVEKLQKFKSYKEIDSQILSTLRVGEEEIKRQGIYIFGVGKLGHKVHTFLTSQHIPVLGYIDNNKNLQGKTKDETRISGAEILKPNDIVYIASETYLSPIQKQLKESGLQHILSHFQGNILFKSLSGFPVDMYYQNLTEDLVSNKEKYLGVFSLLQDEASKTVFDNLLHYRLTGGLQYIDRVARSVSLEYFDSSVIGLSDSEVFFDCGGFDGDSALNFINFSHSQYKSIHIFEPDQQLLSKARNKLAGHDDIYFSDSGIFDKTTRLSFDLTGGLDGSIANSGNFEINAIALDEYKTADIPTYIKLDIEGVEIEALNGAKKIIQDHRPKLAIASYHYPKHFWEVPLHVLKINPKYNLHLRHYSNCIFGSTYYFLP